MGGAIAIAVLGNALVLGLVFLIYRLGRASTTDQQSTAGIELQADAASIAQMPLLMKSR
jgi:hypothetical protein